MNPNIARYIELIESFQSGLIDAARFEREFLQLFKNDEASVDYSAAAVDILDELFAAVDEYCSDPNLRSQLPKSLDEEELRLAANLASERLRKLPK
jgi:hypothetical protein